MDKKKSISTILIHLFWALSWSVGVYYVEYGIFYLFAVGGVDKVISANVTGGAILFLLFYLLERKLVEEGLTKRSFFIVSSYVIPLLYQGAIIVWIGKNIPDEDSVISAIFIFTFILVLMGLFFRGMLEVVNYYRKHIKSRRKPL